MFGLNPSCLRSLLCLTVILLVSLAQAQKASDRALQAAYAARMEGRMADARAKFLEAIVALETEGAQPQTLSLAHKNLADLATNLQDFLLADEHYRKAIELRKDLPMDWDHFDLLMAQHSALRALGRFDEAYAPVQRALDFCERTEAGSVRHFNTLKTFNRLFYLDTKWAEAASYAKDKLLPFAKEHFGGSIYEIDALQLYADSLTNTGAGDAAFPLFKQIYDMNKALWPNSVQTVRAYQNITIHRPTHEVKLIGKELREVHQMILRVEPGAWFQAYSSWLLAPHELKEGNLEAAEGHADACWKWFARNLRTTQPYIIAKVHSGDDQGHAARSMIDVYLKLGKPEKAIQVLQDLQGNSIMRKITASLVEADRTDSEIVALSKAEAKVGAALQEVALKAGKRSESEREMLRREAEKQPADSAKAAVKSSERDLALSQATLAKAEAEYDLVLTRVRAKRPNLFPPAWPLQDSAKYLRSGSLYLGYYIGSSPNMQLMTVNANGQVENHELGIDVFELRDRVNDLRSKLLSRNPAAYESLRYLYGRLVPARVQSQIDAAQSLVITPDGPLWEMPFGALIAGSGQRSYYLGLAKPITLTPSLSLFGMSQVIGGQKAKANPVKALIVGDCTFTNPGATPENESQQLSILWGGTKPPPPLPGTRAEATEIAALYNTAPALGAAATEGLVRDGLKNCDIVHIATHGYVNNDHPLASGLLLTRPKRQVATTNEDGGLLAWEVAEQVRARAQLVVLSACETGLGRSLRAEGVDGLVRAFSIAGVPSIVSSLWRVDDTSTARLMAGFHKKVRAGVSYDEALRLAMLSIQANEETAEPYFWAPFFLSGDLTNRLFAPGS